MQVKVIEFYEMLKGIPEEKQPTDMGKFWSLVSHEMRNLLLEAARAKGEAQVVFNPYRIAGEQYIWEFFVNDLAKPVANQHNFHGQNTSQWLYAGCVLLQDCQVSLHH